MHCTFLSAPNVQRKSKPQTDKDDEEGDQCISCCHLLRSLPLTVPKGVRLPLLNSSKLHNILNGILAHTMQVCCANSRHCVSFAGLCLSKECFICCSVQGDSIKKGGVNTWFFGQTSMVRSQIYHRVMPKHSVTPMSPTSPHHFLETQVCHIYFGWHTCLQWGAYVWSSPLPECSLTSLPVDSRDLTIYAKKSHNYHPGSSIPRKAAKKKNPRRLLGSWWAMVSS